MKRTPELDAKIAVFVARLVDAEDEPSRDGVLLEAALAAVSACAVALWVATAEGWRPLLERGQVEALPRPELVSALLEGTLGMDVLPAGQLVVRNRLPDGNLALALGGVAPEEDPHGSVADVLEALLHLRRLIEADDGGAAPRPHPALGSPAPPRDSERPRSD